MKKILILTGILAYYGSSAQSIQWPHHKKAVIVLTYDDALSTQLDTAVPQLERAGLKATFFLTSDIDSSTIPRWRKLAGRGFELANHTVFHPCSSGEDVSVHSEQYTPQQIVREIGVMNNFLFAVDGRSGRTFAYPCAETTVGGVDYVDSLRSSGLIKYARIGGDSSAVITDFKNLDLLRIPSLGLEDSTSAGTLIAFVKSVEQRGGMGIIMFHGIGGDYITTLSKDHQTLLNYLKANKKTLWIPTFQEAMDYVTKQPR